MELKRIKDFMHELVDGSPLNRVDEEDFKIDKIFDYPLVKVADASDPLFERLKEPEVVGEHYLLPSDWLPGARSVISYFLPFSLQVREANRVPGWAAREWLYGRIEGEEFNNSVRQHLVDLVEKAGGRAVAPLLDSRMKVENLRCNWSERHVAYIAGLGTFGLSKSMITEKGSAGRYGSLVVDLEMAPSLRPYKEIDEYCNFCGECIDRCPPEAITQEGKDVTACSRYLKEDVSPRFKPRYGCGKCQTGVPCEERIP